MFGLKKINYKSDSECICHLKEIVNFDSPYAPDYNDPKYEKKKKNMLEDILSIEDSISYESSDYLLNLDIAYRNYTAWFIRGDDRIPFYKKQVEILTKAIEIDSSNYLAKVELLDLLINHVQVRDLDRALQIASDLENAGKLPDYMQGHVQKAKKWKGEFEIPEKINFSQISSAPGILREQKSYLVSALKFYLDNNDERASLAARWLYNLAIYSCKLYGGSFKGHIANPKQFEKAAKLTELIADKIDFDYKGRISDCEFLSTADYNKIEKALGKSEKTVTLRSFKI